MGLGDMRLTSPTTDSAGSFCDDELVHGEGCPSTEGQGASGEEHTFVRHQVVQRATERAAKEAAFFAAVDKQAEKF